MSKISRTAEATIQKLINTDTQYTITELAKATGIAILTTVPFILKKRRHARMIFTSWMPHLLSDDKKRTRVTFTLKISLNFDKNMFANDAIGVETWVKFYESQGQVRNKFWATKSTKGPCSPRRSMSVH